MAIDAWLKNVHGVTLPRDMTPGGFFRLQHVKQFLRTLVKFRTSSEIQKVKLEVENQCLTWENHSQISISDKRGT